jgi:hypothetical protein
MAGAQESGDIFTTNYDLIPYWAIMHKDVWRFRDMFWGEGNTFYLAKDIQGQTWSDLVRLDLMCSKERVPDAAQRYHSAIHAYVFMTNHMSQLIITGQASW